MKRLITFFALIAVWASSALAHDFEVNGIYYVKNSDGTSVSVSYRGTSSSQYSDEYSGSVNIPPSVVYSGKFYDVTSIGYEAFYDCSGLTSVTIPNSVTEISQYAFSGCSGLKSIEIPNSVTSIKAGVFRDCRGLTSVTIPNSVTEIGYYAFRNCSGLTSVTIPNSVTTIGSSAFSGCYGLTSVTIPNSVTSIGGGAFEGTPWYNNQPNGLVYAGKVAYKYKGTMTSGTSIAINEGTVSISPYCFQNCSGLTSVTIPNSVTSIGERAFQNCSRLTSVTIPNSVTEIGYYAFRDCSRLTSVTIPNSVTSIGSSAFEGTPWYNNQPNGLVYAGKVAYKYKGTMPSGTFISINEGTVSISPSCFYDCSGLTSVTIPNSVTSIGGSAFEGCSGLTGALTIPNSVTSIGYKAFYNCSGLTSLTIPNSVTTIGESAFNGCRGLTGALTIPNSVTSIGNSAFNGCSGLTGTLTIGNSVKKIGDYAFQNCSGLTGTLTIPNSVTSIGERTFYNCSGLTGTLTIPNSVTSIGERTFYNCSGLKSVTIGNSVTSIGDDAFYGCSGLTSVKWDARNCDDFTNTKAPFRGLTSITSFTFGNEVQKIPTYLCIGISGLTSVTIPNSVTSIGYDAFYGCSGLTSVTIGNSVTSIGSSAFEGCRGLTSITFPNSVTSIGNSAFYGCSGLTSIINPYNIKTIGAGAFQGTKWFDNQPSNTLVYVGNVAYKFKGTLKYYNYSFAFRDGTVSISPRCFYEESLTTCNPINIPNTVKVIGESAFYRLNPQSITIGTSVESIGKSAFVSRDNSSSSRLATLIWNAKNCSSNGNMTTSKISTVIIGNSVETLPARFVEGSQITDVTIPGSVKTIGDNAFASCSKLSTVTNYALTPQSINESVFQNVDVSFCTLYVPAESNSLYASANVWKDFFIQNAGVEGVEVDKSTKEIEGYYNLHGIRIKEPIRGQVNIVRYSDGSAEKLVIKE